MASRRIAKLTQAIREQVSTSILFGLKDPRVKNVTVTRVEVSGDAQHAKIYVSVLGDDKASALCLHGLNSARGFLQAKVAARIQTRYTPILSFELDPGIKHSVEVAKLLRDIKEGDSPAEETPEYEQAESPIAETTD